jgi:hypothetical protein
MKINKKQNLKDDAFSTINSKNPIKANINQPKPMIQNVFSEALKKIKNQKTLFFNYLKSPFQKKNTS